MCFGDTEPDEVTRQLRVWDEGEELAAVLDFSSSRERPGVELLDAEKQVPRMRRE